MGIDLAPRMLRVARRRAPHALLVRADARSLPFGEGAFDLVWSSYFLDLVPTAELTPLLREFRRVLRPGGRLLLVSLSQKGEARLGGSAAIGSLPPGLCLIYSGAAALSKLLPWRSRRASAQIERQVVSQGLDSEVILGRNPL